MVCESPKSSFCSASQSTCSDRAAYDPPQLEGGVGATMGPPTTTGQPLRRARHGIRGDLVLYAVGLGSMLLGGSVVHAVARPDLVRCWVAAARGRRVSQPPPLVRIVNVVFLPLWVLLMTSGRPGRSFFKGGGSHADAPLICVLYVLWPAALYAAVTRGGGSGGVAVGA